MRLHRTTGLASDQLDAVTTLVRGELAQPWDGRNGAPKKLGLREAVAVTCAYLRQNIIEEVLGEIFGVSQPTVSRVLADLTPVVARIVAGWIPDVAEAMARATGRICLVDGTLGPCWSWADRRDLWSGKHSTTGHNFLVICDLAGREIWVSEPLPGRSHDMTALRETMASEILGHAGGVIADKGFQGAGYVTPVKKPPEGELLERENEYNNRIASLRAPNERTIANLKTWRILHTDYRRPISTYKDSHQAAIGLHFLKLESGI